MPARTDLEIGDRRTVAQQIYQTLKRAILGGSFSPGQRLPEAALAARLNAGRAPLREALRHLEGDGLISMHPHRGASVASFSRTDVDELCSLVTLLEGYAAGLVAERIEELDLRPLQEIVEAMRAASDAPDSRVELLELDTAFHRSLVELAGHARLLRMYTRLSWSARLATLGSHDVLARPDHLAEDLAASHQIILDVLREGDPAWAEAYIRARDSEVKRRLDAARGGGAAGEPGPAATAEAGGPVASLMPQQLAGRPGAESP